MSTVTISIANRKFELDCSTQIKEHVVALAGKLDDQTQQILESNPSSSFELALVIVALNLQDAKQRKFSDNTDNALKEVEQDFLRSLRSIDRELDKVLTKLPK